MLTQKVLKEFLHYSPETGLFTRAKQSSSNAKVGDIAGGQDGRGYIQIGIKGKRYKAHRLAFLYMKGRFPRDQVDHEDRNRINNKWDNLREVSNQENCRNRGIQSNNNSGFHGVYWYKAGKKWHAQIQVSGKTYHLGYFKDIGDAIEARSLANIKYGFHENHGAILQEAP